MAATSYWGWGRWDMKPGLTQTALAAVDQFKLDGLLAKALSRREAYESAIRDIEQLIGMDVDEMGFDSDGDMVECDAATVIAHAQAALDGEGGDDGEEED